MQKLEVKKILVEAISEYLEPLTLAANTTRIALGLPVVDITQREEIQHEIDYFTKGFYEGKAGFWDKWYEDKKAFKAYQAGNFKGRELYAGNNFQVVGFTQ